MDEQPQQNLILNDQLSNDGTDNLLQSDPLKQQSPLVINGETHVSLRPSARRSNLLRKAERKNKAKHIVYTIKDYTLMFILLIVSIPNYSILSLFYLLFH